MPYIHDYDRRPTHGHMHQTRRYWREAGRGTRLFGIFLGLALVAYVAYMLFASVATYNAIDANESASQPNSPQATPAAPATK